MTCDNDDTANVFDFLTPEVPEAAARLGRGRAGGFRFSRFLAVERVSVAFQFDSLVGRAYGRMATYGDREVPELVTLRVTVTARSYLLIISLDPYRIKSLRSDFDFPYVGTTYLA